ncbi:MAG TPA: HAD-IB family phosphatase [Acidimicrobiales bacterium]|nr:HAD-IB family phosphatase [Acidimicrobiales bacterium]
MLTTPLADPAQTTVFLDFDGTISARSVSVHLLERHGAAGWREVDDRYIAGEIGSREAMAGEWRALADVDEATLRATAREVPLDPGARPLVRALQAVGADIVVLSDGFGFYVHEAVADLAIPVLTNDVTFDGRMTHPASDPTCPCAACGTCKAAPLRAARAAGRRTVFIGDGVSDRRAAAEADLVYAKARLASWCEAEGVAFVRYEVLDDVRRHLLGQA